MHEQKASSSVMNDTFHILKQVVASVKDEDFEPVFNVKWDLEVIDMPDVKKKESKAFSGKHIEETLVRSNGQYRTLFAFLAATGLRIGEAQAVEIGADPETTTTLSKDCRVLYVNTIILQSGEKQDCPKTAAGRREVDIHPDVAKMLLELIGTRASGYLFCTSNGTPLSYGNIRKNVLDKILYDVDRPIMKREGKRWKQIGVNKVPGVVGPPATEGYGFHSFRRFRITYLQTDAAIPEAYVKYWAGHGKKDITEIYTKVKQNTAKRRELCEQAELGFALPKAGKVVAVNSKKDKVKAA